MKFTGFFGFRGSFPFDETVLASTICGGLFLYLVIQIVPIICIISFSGTFVGQNAVTGAALFCYHQQFLKKRGISRACEDDRPRK